jgi:hypothetical protein
VKREKKKKKKRKVGCKNQKIGFGKKKEKNEEKKKESQIDFLNWASKPKSPNRSSRPKVQVQFNWAPEESKAQLKWAPATSKDGSDYDPPSPVRNS